MAEVKRKMKSDDVYRVLKDKLVTGELAPGQRLSEAKVATMLSVSRMPVREAMLKLQVEGLLADGGAYCSKYVHFMEDEDLGEVLEHYQVREAIEGLAARLAALHMTGIQIIELRALDKRVQEAFKTDDWASCTKAAVAFHRYLMANCGNKLLSRMWETFHLMQVAFRSSELGRTVWANVAKDREPGAEFSQVVEAIAAHDPDEAEIRMRQVISRLREAIRDVQAARSSVEETACQH